MGMLDGKVVFITGGARGQGRAHAEASAREGADIICVDIDDRIDSVPYSLGTATELKETAQLVEAHGRRCVTAIADVRSQTQLDSAVALGIEEFGHIDVLIANSGIFTLSPFWEMAEGMWQDMIDVNLTGVWKAAKAVTPHMIERGSGSIVITSSVNGLEPGENYGHYTAAKHGLIGLMKTIALELAPHGIRCNAICPGPVNTHMTGHQEALDLLSGHPGGTAEEARASVFHFQALKGMSLLPPEAIANTALYLNSDLASVVTGASIPVDAGHMVLTGFNMAPVTD